MVKRKIADGDEEEQLTDDANVTDEEESAAESDEEPKKKKPSNRIKHPLPGRATTIKSSSKKKAKVDKEDTKELEPQAKSNKSSAPTVKKSEDGGKYIDLGKLKRATVREFKGTTFIDIREFYVDKESGQEKPGKKGISLIKTQWEELKANMDVIDSLIGENK